MSETRCVECGHVAADHTDRTGACWHGSLNAMTVRCGCFMYQPAPSDAEQAAAALRDTLSPMAHRNRRRNV